MAQAFRRFGAKVDVLEAIDRILGPEDEDASKVLHKVLEKEGVGLHTGLKIASVEHTPQMIGHPWPEIRVKASKTVDGNVVEFTCVCDALLVATGRVPNVEGLGLEAAGVEYTPAGPAAGIKVNDDLSTSNPDIFAVGDVIDQPQLRFTHMAGTMAGMAVQNALFAGRGLPVNAPSAKLSELVVPRTTFTEPEVASCGVSNLVAAERAKIEVDVYSSSIAHNDRAILEGDEPEGYVKVLCKKGTDTIVGATIVAERAGDVIAELTLAAQHGLGLSAIARTVHPYPTVGEAVQQCALNYNRARWEKLGAS
jgi:pyruvate/2-oxoglutarate dehydrogenase complex dihydrolipoamide dehydrogenase (E3) component